MQVPKEIEERQKCSTKYNVSFIFQNEKDIVVTELYLLLSKTSGRQKTFPALK